MYKERLTEQPKNDSEVITVLQKDRWKIIEGDHNVDTGGMGPCVGIFIHSPDKTIAGHFSYPKTDGLTDMLEEVKRDFPDFSELKVDVGGESKQDDEVRSFVENALKNLEDSNGNKFSDDQITIKWSEPHHSLIMRINTETGDVEYDDRNDTEEYEAHMKG